MLKVDHKIVIAYTTTNVIGVTTVFVKYPKERRVEFSIPLSKDIKLKDVTFDYKTL